MAKVIMLIGVPGSGKTTFAHNLSLEKGYKVISSDVIRQTFPGIKENNVFPTVYEMCVNELRNGRDIILDATNITPKVRKRAWDALDAFGVKYDKVAYYFITDPNKCMERVAIRNTLPNERYLPVEVIKGYGEKIIAPAIEEGFKEIIVIDNNKHDENYQNKVDFELVK